MNIRYTKPAARQLAALLDYIAENSPMGANKVFDRIEHTIAMVARHPYVGRLTTKPSFRVIPVYPYPYVIFYSISETDIIIHAIRHAARRPLL